MAEVQDKCRTRCVTDVVNDNLLSLYCKAQRAEQARQELITQVRESAAKTLESIRG